MCWPPQAGKDIYCEKPISLTIRQARTMAETVRRHNRVFQTGLQQRNSPEYRKAMQIVHAGRIGEVKLAYVSESGVSPYQNLPAEPLPEGLDWEMWLGPCPWHPYNYQYHHAGQPKNVVPWSCNRAFGAGDLTSGLVHNLDSAHEGLRKDGHGPVKITPAGIDGAPSLTFTYADGTRIVCSTTLQPGQTRNPAGLGPGHADPELRRAVRRRRGLGARRAVRLLNCYPKHVLDCEIPEGTFRRGQPPGLAGLHPHATPPRADVEIGACSTILAHLGCIAPVDRPGPDLGPRCAKSSRATRRQTCYDPALAENRGACSDSVRADPWNTASSRVSSQRKTGKTPIPLCPVCERPVAEVPLALDCCFSRSIYHDVRHTDLSDRLTLFAVGGLTPAVAQTAASTARPTKRSSKWRRRCPRKRRPRPARAASC